MTRMRSTLCGATAVVLAVLAANAYPYTIDGNLADWGVTPFSDWVPKPAVSYVLENWGDAPSEWGSYPHGGETFDLEAGYAVVSGGYLWVAMVSSFPESGWDLNGTAVEPGDLAIDIDGDGLYEFGVKGWGTMAGRMVENPTWSLPHASIGLPANGPSTATGGTFRGFASFIYFDAGVLEPDGTHTYIIEMAIPMVVLGDWDLISLHYTQTCGNDALDWDIPIPEPSCVALMALVALGIWRRRG